MSTWWELMEPKDHLLDCILIGSPHRQIVYDYISYLPVNNFIIEQYEIMCYCSITGIDYLNPPPFLVNCCTVPALSVW